MFNLFENILSKWNIPSTSDMFNRASSIPAISGGSGWGIQPKNIPIAQKSIQAENNMKAQGFSDKEIKFLKLQKDKWADSKMAMDFIMQKREEVKQQETEKNKLGIMWGIKEWIIWWARVWEQIPRYAGNLLNLTQEYVTTPLIAGSADLLWADEFADKWRSAGARFGAGAKQLWEDITRAWEWDITENQRNARRVWASVVATAPIPLKWAWLVKGTWLWATATRGAIAWAQATPIYTALEEWRLPTGGEMAVGTLWGAVLGTAIEKAVVPWIQKWAELIQRKINPAKFSSKIDTETTDLIRKAVRPSVSWVDTVKKFDIQDEKLLQWVKEIVKQWEKPKNSRQMMESIQKTKQNLWAKVEQANQAVTKTTNGSDISLKVRQFANDTENRAMFLSRPELKWSLLKLADDIDSNPEFANITQRELQDILTDVNSRIPASSFLKQLDSNPTETAKNTILAKVYREIIDDNLEQAIGTASQADRMAYWAVRQLEKDFAKRYAVYLRQNPQWLADMFGMEWFADMAVGLLTSSPSQVARGAIIQWVKKLIKNQNNPDTIIREIFKLQGKVKWIKLPNIKNNGNTTNNTSRANIVRSEWNKQEIKLTQSNIPWAKKTTIETPLNPKGNESKILAKKQGVMVEKKEPIKLLPSGDRARKQQLVNLSDDIARSTKSAQYGGTGNSRVETTINGKLAKWEITKSEALAILEDVKTNPKYSYIDKRKLDEYIATVKGGKIDTFDDLIQSKPNVVVPKKDMTPRQMYDKLNEMANDGRFWEKSWNALAEEFKAKTGKDIMDTGFDDFLPDGSLKWAKKTIVKPKKSPAWPTTINTSGKKIIKKAPESPVALERGFTTSVKKPIVKRASDIDTNPIVNERTWETLSQAVDKLRKNGWSEKDIAKFKESALWKKSIPVKKEWVLDTVNPTWWLFVDYTPAKRANSIISSKNLTTLDKTLWKSPDDYITIYRGTVKWQKEMNPWDFVTDMPELAKSYAWWDKVVISKRVKYSDVIDSINESWWNEYIYIPKEMQKWDNKIKK